MGDVRLEGPDNEIWFQTYAREMVAFDSRKSEDALSDWITSRLLDVYHKLIGQWISKVRLFTLCERTTDADLAPSPTSR